MTRSWSPVRAAVVLIAVVAGAHVVGALAVQGPIYLPDEYFYTAIGRSIAGGGPPTVRGGPFQFVSILEPLLTAPAWLVHNVTVAYRLAQIEGVLAMIVASLPAFAIGRRIGLSERGAATAAVLTVLVPDTGYGAFLLSEPFAYPLFLTTFLLALNALHRPTARSEAVFVAGWVVLCLARVQFFFFLPVYLLAGILLMPGSRRDFLRRRRLSLCAFVVVLLSVLFAAPSLVGQYAPLGARHPGLSPLLHWAGLNLLVLFVASGWVVVPGALAGLIDQLRQGESIGRAFAALSLLCIGCMLGEAALFGADLDQLMERYTFYAVPLLLVAFLSAMERGRLGTGFHRLLAGGLVGLALFLPLDSYLFTGRPDHSPVLFAYSLVERHLGWRSPLLTGALLLVLSLFALASARLRRPDVVVAACAAFSVALGTGYALATVRASSVAPSSIWTVSPGTGSASYLAASDGTRAQAMMMVLFWNRSIDRVLVLGTRSPDTYPALQVGLEPGGRLESAQGPVRGAVMMDGAFGFVSAASGTIEKRGVLRFLPHAERTRLTILGEGFLDGGTRLSPTGEVLAAAAGRSARVTERIGLELGQVKADGKTLVDFTCSNGFSRRVQVGRSTRIALPLEGWGIASCRFAFLSGPLHWWRGQLAPLRVRSVRISRLHDALLR